MRSYIPKKSDTHSVWDSVSDVKKNNKLGNTVSNLRKNIHLVVVHVNNII